MDKSDINIQRSGELCMYSVWLQSQMTDLIILKRHPEYIDEFVGNQCTFKLGMDQVFT